MSGDSVEAVSSAAGALSVETMLPGPALAQRISGSDVARLDDYDVVEQIAACERLIAWATERQLVAAAEFARRPAPSIETAERASAERDPARASRLRAQTRAAYAPLGVWAREFADDEVAARLRISRVAASVRIRMGCGLTRLPTTSAALSTGRIDVNRARVVAEETAPLDRAGAGEVDVAVAGDLDRLSPRQLRASVQRAVVAVDPDQAEQRVERAQAERRVVITPAEDGMADLYARLPALDALAIGAALTAAARSGKARPEPGDERTMDQRRADALVAPFARALATGVLDGAQQTRLARHRGEFVALQVTVAASTLLGHDDVPAQLAGYGPITAEVARAIAPDARWRRILTDPVSGAVLDVGADTYRPSVAAQRHVEVRDVLCQHPGCGWPAMRCDLDHVVPFPEGKTCPDNLTPRCRRHHRFKHSGQTRVERDDSDGSTTWTMPTGHSYRIEPPPLGLPIDDVDLRGALDRDDQRHSGDQLDAGDRDLCAEGTVNADDTVNAEGTANTDHEPDVRDRPAGGDPPNGVPDR